MVVVVVDEEVVEGVVMVVVGAGVVAVTSVAVAVAVTSVAAVVVVVSATSAEYGRFLGLCWCIGERDCHVLKAASHDVIALTSCWSIVNEVGM